MTTTDLRQQSVQQQCKQLRLPTVASQCEPLAQAAERERQPYLGYLEALLASELEEREQRTAYSAGTVFNGYGNPSYDNTGCEVEGASNCSGNNHLVEQIRFQVGNRSVFFLVSGGVDSTVAFTLCAKALSPDRLLGVTVVDAEQARRAVPERARLVERRRAKFILQPRQRLAHDLIHIIITVSREPSHEMNARASGG